MTHLGPGKMAQCSGFLDLFQKAHPRTSSSEWFDTLFCPLLEPGIHMVHILTGSHTYTQNKSK